ncbi:MAG: hypothetical protein R2792_10025 [Saprospiraceae bacterium]
MKQIFITTFIFLLALNVCHSQKKDDWIGYISCMTEDFDQETLNRLNCDLIQLQTIRNNCINNLSECKLNCRESNMNCFRSKWAESGECRNRKRDEFKECRDAKKSGKEECKQIKENTIDECNRTLRGRAKRQCKKGARKDFRNCKQNLKGIKKRCKNDARGRSRECQQVARANKRRCLAELESRIENCRNNCGDCQEEIERYNKCLNSYRELAPPSNIDRKDCARRFLPNRYDSNCDSGLKGNYGTKYVIRNTTDENLIVYVCEGFRNDGTKINGQIIEESLPPNVAISYTIECDKNLWIQGESLRGITTPIPISGENCCSSSNIVNKNFDY